MEKTFTVYIIASLSRRLYTGITGDIQARMLRHKRGEGSKFAAQYNIHRLVYHERFQYARDAIAREKEIKTYYRTRKLNMIEQFNPGWVDFAESWFSEEELRWKIE
jgi:putative endonuclease